MFYQKLLLIKDFDYRSKNGNINWVSALLSSEMHYLSIRQGLTLSPVENYEGCLNRGSYVSAHVLLNLLNELGKRDKMRGLPSILSLFPNSFNKFNKIRARMLDSIYHMTNTLKFHFWRKNVIILSLYTQRCYGRHNVSRKSINH